MEVSKIIKIIMLTLLVGPAPSLCLCESGRQAALCAEVCSGVGSKIIISVEAMSYATQSALQIFHKFLVTAICFFKSVH